MPLLACEGCIKDIFVTEAEFIDRFTGKQLWMWGWNTNGELGTNNRINRSSPIQTVSCGTDWNQVALGGTNTTQIGQAAAIKTDGTLWTWGCGNFGVLGDETTVNRSSPVQTISGGTNWKQVSACGYTTGAIKTNGTLWLWGWGDNGKLGNENTVTRQSSPVQTISGGTNWKKLSVGYSFVSAIKTDGTLWLWGANNLGQIGDETIINRSSPVQAISAGTNWKTVSSGTSMGAIKTDGTLWLWGSNTNGELGSNDAIARSSPVQTISGGTNWKQVSAGGFNFAAIKTDGTLWTWGFNCSGILGDGTITTRSSPVQTVSGGTNWRCVSASLWTTGAIKTDGTLWMWGLGTRGEIGNNSIISRSSPIQTASGGTSWKNISSGIFRISALRTEE